MWKFDKSVNSKSDFINTPSTQVCFWGRSNVGKSSLINSITGQNISFVSKNPGRTKMVNYFKDNNDKYLVDLPGYGYAKMSKNELNHMMNLTLSYLNSNQCPKHLFLLIDSRTGITKIDFEMINLINSHLLNLTASLVYTKSDKLNQKERAALIKQHNQYIDKSILNKFESVFFVSSKTGRGMEDLVIEIENILYEDNNN